MIKWQSSTNPAPGPKGLPLVGSSLDFRKDALGFLSSSCKSYGGIYSFYMTTPVGRLLTHVIQKPEHVQHVLKDRYQSYRKAGTYTKHMRGIIGNGLLTSEGEFWRKHRRIAQPAFHRKSIDRLGSVMVETTESMLHRSWESKVRERQPVDVYSEMTGLTLNIVGRSLFAADLARETSGIKEAVSFLLRYTDQRVRAIVRMPERLPTPSRRRYEESLATLDEVIYRIIGESRASEAAGDANGNIPNLISTLSAVRDEDTGEGMSEREIRDEVLTLLVAGHETTASALSWTFYLISEHPGVYQRLSAELAEVLSGRAPTADDFTRLSYTQMVFKEAMRLYPPVWGIPRIAVEDDEIGGYLIPEESRVLVSPYLAHRDPEMWNDPEAFDPERFTPANERARPRFAYFPFGGGPRQCMGNNFALMEGVMVLATVAQKYRPKPAPGSEVRAEVAMTLRPRGELPLVFEHYEAT